MGDVFDEWLIVREAGRSEAPVDLGRAPVRIGRSSDNDVVLADTYASAHHAELVRQRGRRALRDLGSRNGTVVNGTPLAPGVLHPLSDGDLIQIGTSELTYCRAPSPNGTAGPAARADRRPGRPSLRSGGRAATAAPAEAGALAPEAVLAPPAPRRSRLRALRLAARAVVVLAAVLLLAAGVAWALAPARVVLLVLGSDARPDELRRGEVGRTDTLLTVVADRAPAGLALISIPRDLWVPIPGYGEERVNTAYALGGPRTARQTVADVLGVPVDRYLVIGLQGVRDVVDAAGGVEIDVPRPIHDDAYPTDDYGTIVVDIPAGRQHMDGETALRYMRTRHQDSDFGRMARQQQVLTALRGKLARPTSWWRIPAVVTAARRATQTDLGVAELVTLGLAAGTSGAPPERLALDLGLVEEMPGANGAYLLRPRPALRQRVATLLNPSTAAVDVLNGTATAGHARQAADRLAERGLRVVNVGNASRRQPETTIEVRPGLGRSGALVAEALGLPRERVQESAALPAGVDVRVTLGG